MVCFELLYSRIKRAYVYTSKTFERYEIHKILDDHCLNNLLIESLYNHTTHRYSNLFNDNAFINEHQH